MQMESHARGDNQGECLRQYLRPRGTRIAAGRQKANMKKTGIIHRNLNRLSNDRNVCSVDVLVFALFNKHPAGLQRFRPWLGSKEANPRDEPGRHRMRRLLSPDRLTPVYRRSLKHLNVSAQIGENLQHLRSRLKPPWLFYFVGFSYEISISDGALFSISFFS